VSRSALNEAIAELPYRLRERVDGYAAAVAAEAPAIFADAEVSYNQGLANKLVFIAGIKKLWAIVDADCRLLTTSLGLVEGYDVASLSVGSTTYSRGSSSYRELIDLRHALERLLLESGVMSLVWVHDLAALVRAIADEQTS